MNRTSIEYADFTWNPVVGCSPISDGCRHCYARALHDKRQLARRSGAKMPFQYAHDFDTAQLMEHRLDAPARRKKPATIFVCNMGDLFYNHVPDKWIFTVFDAMRRTPQHRFMVLTKRPARMSRVLDGMEPAPNVWLGVSMESNLCEARVQTLDSMDPQWPRWVSAEPLLGPLSFPKFRRLDFVVCGCESGPGRRPMDAQWARCLRDWCADNGSRFMLKQMVVDGTLERLPELDGRRHADRPGSEAA